MEAGPAKSSRTKWLYAAGLAAVVVAYALAIHQPNRRAMARMRMELDLKRQSTQVAAMAAEIAQVQQGIDKAQQYLAKVRKTSSRADAARLFGDISAMARDSGVRTRRFEPSPAIEHGDLLQSPLAIECDGSFAQIFSLLQRLEGLSQIVWINTLQIQASKSRQGELLCKVNLEVFADKHEISD